MQEQDNKLFGQSEVSCPDNTCPPLIFCVFTILLSPILFPFVFLCVCVHVPTRDGSR